MFSTLNRRKFLQLTATGVGSFSALSCYAQTTVPSVSDKLRIAIIGCGPRGVDHLLPPAVMNERVVALVDPDSRRIEVARQKIKQLAPNTDFSRIRTFCDYRKLFDEMASELDAVMIAAPNHHHALPTLLAIRNKIHVYVEKPMALTVQEARLMGTEAKKYGVATQVGIHGHSNEGGRRLCEYIWAGAIGQVREVYSWSDRMNSVVGQRQPNCPVPETLNWDVWLGSAPYRDYHPGLHLHDWHDWIDFGNGSIGNMGNHILDPIFWSLKLNAPSSVEMVDFRPGIPGTWPVKTHLLWKFPEREGMAPVDIHWFDGIAGDLPVTREYVGGIGIFKKREYQNLPPIIAELEAKHGVNLGRLGSVLIGDKGILTIGPFGENARFVPLSLAESIPVAPKTIPRIPGNQHQVDFFRSCRGGASACASFDYSVPLSEMVLLGNVAMLTGIGQRLDWDAEKLECTNHPGANCFLTKQYRKGWEI